jgi:hypothetical protein
MSTLKGIKIQMRITVDFEVPQSWPIHADYQILDGRLMPVGDVRRSYSPRETPDLSFEAAKLAKAPDKALIRFARQWGLFGQYEIWQSETLLEDQLQAPAQPGDDVAWMRKHAANLARCISLVERLGRGVNLRRISLSTLHSYVTEGLREVRPQLAWQDGGFVWLYAPRATRQYGPAAITMAWYHVGQAAVDKSPIAHCELCGEPFLVTDRRQRFCPKPNFYSESPCRQRYWYAKRKGSPK